MSVYTGNIVSGLLTFPLIAFAITPALHGLPVPQVRLHPLAAHAHRVLVRLLYARGLLHGHPAAAREPLGRGALRGAPAARAVPLRSAHRGQLCSLARGPLHLAGLLRNPNVYEAFFNVLLLVPLGMYLRYYFRRTWWQTLLIGFATTLFYETSQITGLWGLYAHPYRLFDVDDLMLNTLGAMVGFWAVGPAMRVLPTCGS